MHPPDLPAAPGSKPGRPRRGTESDRSEALLAAATRVFLRDGYALASIDKVASEAGASTRTIYERYRNKAELLAAVIIRLINVDLTRVFSADELCEFAPRKALTEAGHLLLQHLREPTPLALHRMLIREAHRFPELMVKIKSCVSLHLDSALAAYLRRQIEARVLSLPNPDYAADLFLHMLTGELRDRLVFGEAALPPFDAKRHVEQVVDLFLRGALPRGLPPAGEPPP
jgi:AcrR family transcriptional regulator